MLHPVRITRTVGVASRFSAHEAAVGLSRGTAARRVASDEALVSFRRAVSSRLVTEQKAGDAYFYSRVARETALARERGAAEGAGGVAGSQSSPRSQPHSHTPYAHPHTHAPHTQATAGGSLPLPPPPPLPAAAAAAAPATNADSRDWAGHVLPRHRAQPSSASGATVFSVAENAAAEAAAAAAAEAAVGDVFPPPLRNEDDDEAETRRYDFGNDARYAGPSLGPGDRSEGGGGEQDSNAVEDDTADDVDAYEQFGRTMGGGDDAILPTAEKGDSATADAAPSSPDYERRAAPSSGTSAAADSATLERRRAAREALMKYRQRR